MATSEKWIPFFMKGSFIDSKGRPYEATDERLSTILKANEKREVALAIGHPKVNAPAMGWVDAFKRQGDLLFAKVKSLAPNFEGEVKNGHWKKISASVNEDGTLNHIGFFGTQPVAMDGLPSVEFSASDSAAVIEFAMSEAWAIQSVGGIMQRLRDFFIEKFGLDVADRVVSAFDIDYLKNVQPDDPANVAPSFSKDSGDKPAKPAEYADIPDSGFADQKNWKYPINDEEHVRAAMSYWGMPKNREGYGADEVKTITKRILAAAKKFGITVDKEKWQFAKEEIDMATVQELEVQLAAEKAKTAEFSKTEEKNRTLEADLAAERRKNRTSEFAAFLASDELKDKVTPAMKPACMDFMHILADREPFEFSAPDPADASKTVTIKKAPLEAFKEFLKSLPKAIEFSEQATKGKAAGEKLDMTNAQEIASKAIEFQKAQADKGITITVTEAVAQVTKK